MLRCQFLRHVLKAIFFIKIALKLSYFCKKKQNFRALGIPPLDPRAFGDWGLCPQTPSLRQLGTLPPDPHWPPAAGGYASRSKHTQPYPGLGKIDYNRYSIAIFLTFFQSNTPDPLLFGMSIEYAVFFSFFLVKTIFDFFFRKLCNSKLANTPKRIID